MLKREAQLEQTHRAILDAGRELFLSRGFQETSTRDIAKSVGITQPALYHHFEDKEVIFMAVIQEVGSLINDQFKQLASRAFEMTPTQHLMKITNVLTDAHPRDVYTVIHSSFTYLKPENQRQLGIIFSRDYLAPIEAFFESDAVALRKSLTPRQAAEFYITSLSPLFGSFHRIGDAKMTREENVELLLDLILHGVSK